MNARRSRERKVAKPETCFMAQNQVIKSQRANDDRSLSFQRRNRLFRGGVFVPSDWWVQSPPTRLYVN